MWMMLSAVKKEQVDTLFNHLNSVDPHIKFMVEALGNESNITFLDTKCSPKLDHTTHNCVYRKPTQTSCYLY